MATTRFKGETAGERLDHTNISDADMIQVRHKPGTIEDADKGISKSQLQSCPFGVCDTSAGTAAKAASLTDSNPDFTLVSGREVVVCFTAANTASNPTLNFAGSGAIPLYMPNGAPVGAWNAGAWMHLKYFYATVGNSQIQRWILMSQEVDSEVIMASSTAITGKSLVSGASIKIMFTSDITGSNTSTVLSLTYNGTAYNVKVGKNGSLSNFVASEVSSGTYKYVQAYTTLELAFDGTQFIIIGNPVVLSSADYTIYADGLLDVTKIFTVKLLGWQNDSQNTPYTIISKNVTGYRIANKTYVLYFELNPQNSDPAPSSVIHFIEIDNINDMSLIGAVYVRSPSYLRGCIPQKAGKVYYLRNEDSSGNWCPTYWGTGTNTVVQGSVIVRVN